MTDRDRSTGRRGELSEAKRALLEARLRGRSEPAATDSGRIGRRDTADSARLTFAQRRLWFLDQLEPGSLAHVLPNALRINGPLDVDALQKAFTEIVTRHEALRTVFRDEGHGEPVQKVMPVPDTTLHIKDLSEFAEAQREQQAMHWLAEEATRPFDLARGPLFRATWLILADNDHIISTTAHHAVWDGWSAGLFINELGTLYNAFSKNLPSPIVTPDIQYGDFAEWQRRAFQNEQKKEQLAERVARLRGAPALLELPTDRPRPAVQTVNGAMYSFKLTDGLSKKLNVLSLELKATLFMTLFAAFVSLLSRYSGQKDIVVGTPVAGRERPEIESLIGLFANTLCLRTELAGDTSFRELLSRVREEALLAFSQSELPFERLVEALQPSRDRSYSPLFQVMFALQNLPPQKLQLAGAEMEIIPPTVRASPFDLTLYLWDGQTQLQGAFEYNTDLFDESTIAQMFRHYETLLENAVADPDQPISRLGLLTGPEREKLLKSWNATDSEFPAHATLSQLVVQQAGRTPESIAVVFEGQELSYRELDERSNQLARHLQTIGAGRGVLIGIALERSISMVVGLLGVLKAGATYLPLDPTFPSDRLGFMLTDSKATLLITESSLLDALPEHQAQVVCLDRDWGDIEIESPFAPAMAGKPEDLAYVIYTSGSTGQPKGVQISHRAIVNFMTSMQNEPGLSPEDVLLSVTTLSFDISVLEIFLPLCSGAKLVLVSRSTTADGEALLAEIRNSSATVMQATPTTWRLLIAAGWSGDGQLKALCGGEAWSRDLANDLILRCGSVWNMYGPTETTIWSAVQRIESGDDPVLIGRPIANTQLYVLDEYGQPVPIGVPGELYIGGAGLARGYLNRPELTAERFVANPFSDAADARLYRTGDQVRYRPERSIEFLGRLDHQVKIRGFRIELGEIETVLLGLTAVKEAVVVAREDVPGDQRLVAYLVAESGAELSPDELRRKLAAQLPDYMLPVAWVMLDALPLTPNQKIDRNALPEPDARRVAAEYQAPVSPDEEVLAGIWAEVLRVDRVGVHDNFFALGGHSLLATQVTARLRDALRVELPLRAMFESPTIAALAKHVAKLRGGDAGMLSSPLVHVPHDGAMPLSFAQQRLWFFSQLEPGSTAYNMHGAIRFGGLLHIEAMHKSLNRIVQRHEVLRTAISSIDGQPVQQVMPISEIDFPIADLTQLPADEKQNEIAQRMDTEAERPFDLASPPLVRASLIRVIENEHILLLSVHHIAADGLSQALLINELSHLYAGYVQDKTPQLPELPIQYIDYARWQRDYLQGRVLDEQLGYWKNQLGDNLPTLDLPTDSPRPVVQTFQGGLENRKLYLQLSRALREFNREQGVTMFMTLFAAFSIVLARWSGQAEVVIGTPVAGRSRREFEALIGFFVNTLVLRMNLSECPRFIDAVQQARQITIDAQAHQDLPFERLVNVLQPKRDMSRTPLFQVMINMLNVGSEPLQMPGLSVDYLTNSAFESKFDLTLYVAEDEADVNLSLVFNADLFAAPRMAELLAQVEVILEQIVAAPERSLSQANLITSAARRNLPAPTTPLDVEWCGSVAEKLTVFASKQGDKIAVADPVVSWSYAELEARSNRLANLLCQSGLQAGETVVIYGHRSAALVWAVMAILKAGGAFVILDSAYPAAFLAKRVRKARPRVWLQLEPEISVAADLIDALDEIGVSRRLTLTVDKMPDELVDCSSSPPPVDITPDQLAYIAFTSGSTGEAKGVAGTHRPLSHFLAWYTNRFELRPDDRFSMLSGVSHDPLLRDIFSPLWVGGTLCVPAPEFILMPAQLSQWLRDQSISVAHLTPALGQALATANVSRASPYSAMRLLLFGGDFLRRSLVNRIREQAPFATIVNVYGTTETPQVMSYYIVEETEHNKLALAPIGRGIDDVQLLVMTAGGHLAGVGEFGEIHVRTPYLSSGYFDDEMLTAEKFFSNPIGNGSGDRIYRTGDLGRYLPDGNVQIAGRVDSQLKIRGLRIEAGAVEEVLSAHPDVSACAVVAHKLANNDDRLVAFLNCKNDQLPGITELQRFLGLSLPAYMVPTHFEQLQELPLSPNGKLDRTRLPQPDFSEHGLRNSTGRVKPRTPIEVQLCTIWEQLLAIPGLEVGVTDNFFELGGHSLLAVRMLSQLREVFDRELPLETLFQGPTVEKLAAVLSEGGWKSPWKALIAVQPGGSRPPLFLVPGLGGNVLTFVHLANLLGPDQPLYGFQSRGLDGHEEPFTQVQEIAALYLHELRQFKPEGPYLLGGACMGGTVAFEMAQRLVAAGEKVDLLVFIEPSRLLADDSKSKLRIWTMGTVMLTRLLSIFGPVVYLAQRSVAHLQVLLKMNVRQWIPYIREKSSTVKEMIRQQDVYRGDSDFANQENVLNANFAAMRSYDPKTYPGSINIILASERPVRSKHDARLNWIDYSGGDHFIEHIAVKDSGDMFIEPFVHELADKLAAILRKNNSAARVAADPEFGDSAV